MKIESLDRSVQQFLSTGYYRIPRFQRPYSWGPEQLEEFWTDTIIEATGDYFIGAIIVFTRKDDRFDVVDGQQRMTTLTIMMAALRDAFDRCSLPKLANGLHNFIERPNVQFEDEFVLQTETSYPYLHEFIQKHGDPENDSVKIGPEEEALRKAKEFFADKFNDLTAAIEGDPRNKETDVPGLIEHGLSAIRDKLLALRLILVTVDNEDDAYVIFETLNSRGLNLTVADLLKNHLFRHLRTKNANVDTARDRWEKIHDEFARSSASISMDSFIHHQWLSQHEYVSKGKLFRSVKSEITKAKANGYLDALVKDAVRYRVIQEPDSRKWHLSQQPIRQSLEALRIFGVEQPAPFVLAVLRALDDKLIKVPLAKRALRSVENYHFIFTAITGTSSSGGITKMYALHARELSAAADAQEAAASIDALVKKLKVPSEDVFVASFHQLQYSSASTKQKRLVQYVLAKEYAENCSGAVPDFSRMTIEHVLPEASASAASPEAIASIGNLILVDEALNVKLGNKSFASKRKLLAAAAQVWVPPEVLASTQWDQAAIESRADTLAKLAYNELWKL